MTQPPMSKLERKLAERRAAREAEEKAKAIPSEFEDLVPTDDESYERSETDIEIDRLLARIGIIEAYNRWIGKSVPKGRTGQTESIMISCPMPNHPDRNPSAWINSQKNTWYCAGCDRGGDVVDLAAIKFGFDLDSYKSGATFGQLRETIAEDYGFARVHAPGLPRAGALVAPEPEGLSEPAPPASEPTTSVPVPTPVPLATVTPLHPEEPDDEEEDEEEQLPGLAWRELVEPDTFLDTYMSACVVDDVPEEYHFWNGLLALGLAVGRDVTLFDQKLVLANLFVCILGRTGAGKSRAIGHLTDLLEGSIPEEDVNDPTDRGTRALATAGSAEVLIKMFSKEIVIPPTVPGAKPTRVGYAPVRGLIEYDELAAIMARANRSGSTLRTYLMQFYDGKKSISNTSLSNGAQFATEPFASLVTSTQPKALKDLLDQKDVDNGLLNRTIFITGTEKERVAIGGSRVDLGFAKRDLREVWKWAEPGPTGAKIIQWSPEAEHRFSTFFHDVILPMQRQGEDLHRRLDLMMKKLILLFTINEKRNVAPMSAVDKAIKVFWYIVKVLRIPAASIGSSPQTDCEDAILGLIKRQQDKNGNPVPLGYILTQMQKKRIYPREMIERALKTLTNLGMLEMQIPKVAGPGRPAKPRYSLASSH